MDTFMLIYIIFFGILVGGITYIVFNSNGNGHNSNNAGNNREDQNLKYLQQIKRFEYWRDNGQ